MTRHTFFLFLFTASFLNAAEPAALKDGDYTLKITHEARHPRVSYPHAKIPQSSYKPTENAKDLQLRFSENAKKVTILPQKVSGNLQKTDAGKRVYELNEGLFAGGRLILTQTKKKLSAVYTVFGSGVPVISSQRGSVTPKK